MNMKLLQALNGKFIKATIGVILFLANDSYMVNVFVVGLESSQSSLSGLFASTASDSLTNSWGVRATHNLNFARTLSHGACAVASTHTERLRCHLDQRQHTLFAELRIDPS